MNNKKKYNIFSNFFFSIREIASIDRMYIIKRFIFTIFSAIFSFMGAYGIRIAVSGIEQHKDIKTIIIELLIFSVIGFFILFVIRFLSQTFNYHIYKIQLLLGQKITSKSLDIDYQVYERPETQDTIEKLNNYRWFGGNLGIFNNGIDALRSFFIFAIACGIIFSVNIWLIVTIVILALLKMIFKLINNKKDKVTYRDIIPPISRRINYCNNISNNFMIGKDLRIYHMNEFIELEHKKASNERLKILAKTERRRNFYQGIIQVLSIFDELFLYGVMINEVVNNGMSIADFTFMIASVRNLTAAINGIVSAFSNVYSYSLDVIDYRNYMYNDYTISEEKEEISQEPVEIEFKNVYYSYYKQNGYALEDVSFKVKKGEKLGLVGFNGAGKTTIVKLICGLYHPTKGHIYINGIDIDTIKRESLAKLISPVYQDNKVLAFSVGENISMQYKDKTDKDKVNEIIKTVELDEKINSLSSGLDTILTRNFDEHGVELSGGENQKLSLARAMYKNANLYILDEPTSALDALSEYHMYQNFNKITSNNTTIYISHRLSSTKFCDRILFLDKGKVLEEGTHEELMAIDSEYKKLFDTQAAYYQDGGENE